MAMLINSLIYPIIEREVSLILRNHKMPVHLKTKVYRNVLQPKSEKLWGFQLFGMTMQLTVSSPASFGSLPKKTPATWTTQEGAAGWTCEFPT